MGQKMGVDIKELRKKLKLTQKQLARELGVSFATVNRWERGHFKPSAIAQKLIDQLIVEKLEQ